jgi:hypothetical protein
MTLHATCPTNGTEIDLGFTVYATEPSRPPMPRGETRATRLPSGEIRVDVSQCPGCGREHHFIAPAR